MLALHPEQQPSDQDRIGAHYFNRNDELANLVGLRPGEIVVAPIEKLKEDYRREGRRNYPGLVPSRHSSLSTIGTAYHEKD